jgi:two-component system, cell cycle response regulator
MNDELIARIRNYTNLPSLPAVAVQVLDLTQRPQIDTQEIARVISKDPALTTKLLRVVNSSFYGCSQAISTVNQALVILGLQSVKTLVLGFSLATDLAQRKSKGFNHLLYWKRSICAATAAKTIANKIKMVQHDEAFLIGLLMDIGMLVLEGVIGDQYGQLCRTSATHADLIDAERRELCMTHADVAGILAHQWNLPPVLATPIAFSHNPEGVSDPALKRMIEVVELAGQCGDVFVAEDAAGPISTVRKAFTARYNIPESECDAMLAEIGSRTKEMANLFEINIGTYKSYDDILSRAQERLLETTLLAQRQTTELQASNEELKRLTQDLKQKAATDGLTGLANRARLNEFLGEQFGRIASGKPLTMLMMDLDHFKDINDQYGHPVGDAVLQAVAAIVKKVTREKDLAARYGGEELALIMPATPRATGEKVADTIRRAVAAMKVKCQGLTLSVTISIGVATAEADGPLSSQLILVKAADKAVYAAKHAGRNCVKVLALRGTATVAA